MSGTHNKEVSRWYSPRVEREVTLVRWGHFGQPVLLFPTAGGDAEEIERMWLVEALAPLIKAGKIKLYSCDSVAGAALVAEEGDPPRRMYIQDQFHRYVRHEVVSAIHMDCQSDQLDIWSAGPSFGAFHAAAVLCRFPDVFSRAIAMSGTYDLRRFFHTDQFTDSFWVSSPLHFVPTLEGHHLDVLRTRFLLLATGEGRAENIGESWNLANTLGKMGIPNHVDSWGPDWPHDWQTWRSMLPLILGEWTS